MRPLLLLALLAFTSLTALAQPGPPPDGPLPKAARPLAYDLDMVLDPRQTRFSAGLTLSVALLEPADGLWLHGRGIDVADIQAVTETGETLDASYQEIDETGVAWVDWGTEVPSGKIVLRMAYSAPFDRNLAGLFRVVEGGEAYALAKSESIQARKYLPGFDEPAYKAPFTISLIVPQSYEAISNGAIVARTPMADGLERVDFATTRPLPTYLLAIATGPFDRVDRSAIPANDIRDQEIPLAGYARKGRGGELARILDLTPKLLRIFEEEMGQPYPYDKLDIVAAPQWPSGATELAAAVSYRESRILLGEDASPAAILSMMRVHAHELAHMWFGNLVTPPWWDDLWLKEGFATWGTPLSLTLLEPDGGHQLDALARAQRAMVEDSLASAKPVRSTIDKNANIRNAYTGITYSKGQAVIGMVDAAFGSERFRAALGDYIARFADGVADAPAFYQVIGEVSGDPRLTEVFRSFIEQAGLPLLSADLSCQDGAATVALRQSRYAPLGSKIDPDGTRWTLPYCLALPDGEDRCGILPATDDTMEVSLDRCPAWVMPNAEARGYFRFELTSPGWQALVAQFGALSAAEALAAVDSAAAGFEAGKVTAEDMLAVVEAALDRPERQPVSAALDALSRYAGRGMISPTALCDRLGETVKARYEAERQDSDPDSRLLATDLRGFLAVALNDTDIRKDLVERAEAFLDGDRSALSDDAYGSALFVSVRENGSDFYDRLLQARTAIDDPRFTPAAVTALGRTKSPDDAAKARQLILQGQLDDPRDAFALVQALMSVAALREENWAWIKENFPAILQAIPAQWRRRSPTFAQAFCDTDRIDELRALFQTHGDRAPGHEEVLETVVEDIELCAALKNQRGEDLSAALGP
ncbi:MAG: M1 family aminopeptidase [Rhodothalassiaceae bacterium]